MVYCRYKKERNIKQMSQEKVRVTFNCNARKNGYKVAERQGVTMSALIV